MERTYKMALTEVFEILEYLPNDITSKVPQKLMDFIKKEKDDDYLVNINQPLNIQDYSKEAIVLLGMIYKDYLCSQEEKNELEKKTIELYKEYEQENAEKYSSNKLFAEDEKIRNFTNTSDLENNVQLAKTNENWFEKIKKFIKKIINR